MRRYLTLAIAVALAVTLAAPAAANDRRPPDQTIVQNNVLEDPEACGDYGVRWDIHLRADIWRFHDRQGRLTMVLFHITEDNTVTNTATGLTLRDGPIDFTQKENWNPETGVRETIKISGISVFVVRGNQRLIDRGPILIDGQTGEILRSAGPHPIRELMDGSFDISRALPGFCDILA